MLKDFEARHKGCCSPPVISYKRLITDRCLIPPNAAVKNYILNANPKYKSVVQRIQRKALQALEAGTCTAHWPASEEGNGAETVGKVTGDFLSICSFCGARFHRDWDLTAWWY